MRGGESKVGLLSVVYKVIGMSLGLFIIVTVLLWSYVAVVVYTLGWMLVLILGKLQFIKLIPEYLELIGVVGYYCLFLLFLIAFGYNGDFIGVIVGIVDLIVKVVGI